MPTYDYECRACGHRFDELQSFSEPPLLKCPACKKPKLQRLFGGGGAIIFKGGGFYETDYRRAGEKAETGDAPAETPKAETKTETKSEAKADAAPSGNGTSKSEGKSGAKKAK
jgi:putative FmdB family regulatory protein